MWEGVSSSLPSNCVECVHVLVDPADVEALVAPRLVS